ncbi:haloacid dehalogenase [Candidatus Micrarchaeota archaeon CG10_big_fil_rev_8_21_14_0_10_45_29]|nr:MAG: haloacid dehalogenase [Candidatus Micrarchaeota archaeon CG10_big_fil_rev_8_21_14_0_10_45_29]
MKNFKEAKAILFDIDDTLFPSSRFSSLARKKAINAMIKAGMSATYANASAALLKIIKKHGSNSPHHFDFLAKKFKCKNKARCIAAGVHAYHCAKSSFHPFPGTKKTLSLLRKKYIICAASEGKALKQWDKLIRLRLEALFLQVFVSELRHGGKTPAFYKKISKKLKIPPKKIIMLGNSPQKDIRAAKAAGMITIHILHGKNKQKCGSNARISKISQLSRLL